MFSGVCTVKPDPETRKSMQEILEVADSLDVCAKIDIKVENVQN